MERDTCLQKQRNELHRCEQLQAWQSQLLELRACKLQLDRPLLLQASSNHQPVLISSNKNEINQ